MQPNSLSVCAHACTQKLNSQGSGCSWTALPKFQIGN